MLFAARPELRGRSGAVVGGAAHAAIHRAVQAEERPGRWSAACAVRTSSCRAGVATAQGFRGHSPDRKHTPPCLKQPHVTAAFMRVPPTVEIGLKPAKTCPYGSDYGQALAPVSSVFYALGAAGGPYT